MAFTRSTVTTNNITQLANKPSESATTLKGLFDKYGVDDKAFTNSLIAELEANTSATSLGAKKSTDQTTTTVQAELQRLNDNMIDITQGSVADGSITNAKLDFPRLKTQNDTLISYNESFYNSNVSGNVGLSMDEYLNYKLTLEGAITLAFYNATTNKVTSMTLAIVQGATAYAITYPSSVKWANDVVPDTSEANKTHILTFVTFNGGSRWYGFTSGLGFTT